jgi:hypothetical protein
MLITNIKYLVNVREESKLLRGNELAHLPILENAFLKINDSKIEDYGLMSDLSRNRLSNMKSLMQNKPLFYQAGVIVIHI